MLEQDKPSEREEGLTLKHLRYLYARCALRPGCVGKGWRHPESRGHQGISG